MDVHLDSSNDGNLRSRIIDKALQEQARSDSVIVTSGSDAGVSGLELSCRIDVLGYQLIMAPR
jgi:hypothetical protein